MTILENDTKSGIFFIDIFLKHCTLKQEHHRFRRPVFSVLSVSILPNIFAVFGFFGNFWLFLDVLCRFRLNNFWVRKKFGSRNFWVRKMFGSGKFLGPEHFWVRFFLGPNKFWVRKKCGSGQILGPTNFSVRKNFGSKYFLNMKNF